MSVPSSPSHSEAAASLDGASHRQILSVFRAELLADPSFRELLSDDAAGGSVKGVVKQKCVLSRSSMWFDGSGSLPRFLGGPSRKLVKFGQSFVKIGLEQFPSP